MGFSLGSGVAAAIDNAVEREQLANKSDAGAH